MNRLSGAPDSDAYAVELVAAANGASLSNNRIDLEGAAQKHRQGDAGGTRLRCVGCGTASGPNGSVLAEKGGLASRHGFDAGITMFWSGLRGRRR